MPPQSWPILHSPLPDRVTPVYVKAGNIQELLVHMCLQADGNVAFEDTSYPGFGVCRSACYDSSLYIFVLVTFREAVVVCVYVSHVYMHVAYKETRWLPGFARVPYYSPG